MRIISKPHLRDYYDFAVSTDTASSTDTATEVFKREQFCTQIPKNNSPSRKMIERALIPGYYNGRNGPYTYNSILVLNSKFFILEHECNSSFDKPYLTQFADVKRSFLSRQTYEDFKLNLATFVAEQQFGPLFQIVYKEGSLFAQSFNFIENRCVNLFLDTQVYQEIAMYLASQIPDLPTISDEDRLTQHGFDKKSFRSSK